MYPRTGEPELEIQSLFDKPATYYAAARFDLLEMIPQSIDVKRVLDIGCGAGGNAPLLRTRGVDFIAGVEIDHEAANRARKVLDQVIEASIEATEELPFTPGSFDLVICGDVLEHLVNPWRVLRYIRRILCKDGLLVLSLPNIRNWRVIWNLVIRGRFRYQQAGILDITHLWFFTALEIREMLSGTGFTAPKWASNRFGRKGEIIDLLSLHIFHDFFVTQQASCSGKAAGTSLLPC